jgi:thiamine-phosphate pyrophosphorylase
VSVSASTRHQRLDAARLYFVCEARPGGRNAEPILRAALENGADLIQLRDRSLPDEELVAAGSPFRAAADDHDALFILNDRPDLVKECGADGVHLGQDDTAPAEARRMLPGEALIGLSTHSREQIEAAQEMGDEGPDYISVGPVWETPTKAGRPAAGLELIETAARIARLPWFAIGGIDPDNVGDVVAAGAQRVVVVRAIRDAQDPEAAARSLRQAVAAAGGAGG